MAGFFNGFDHVKNKWAWTVVTLLMTVVLTLTWALTQRSSVNSPSSPVKAKLSPPSAQAPQVVFLGTSSLLFADGQSAWMLDGFLSRQPVLDLLTRKLAIEQVRVNEGMARAFSALGVPNRLDGVVVAHSHYDHVLDAPYLAHQWQTQVWGSESTRNIALGQGLASEQAKVMQAGDVLQFGDFSVKVLRSAHAPTGFTGGANNSPLKLPAYVWSFKEGQSFAFVVSHRGRPWCLIQPSAGFVPGQNTDVRVPVVMLGIGGLGKLDPQAVTAYWREMVTSTGAKRVLAIHWDDFTQALIQDGAIQPLKPMPWVMDNLGRSWPQLQALAQQDGVDLQLMQAFERTEMPAK